MSYSIYQLVQQATDLADQIPMVEPKPELPEFAFSPKVKTYPRQTLCTGCNLPIHEKPGETNHWYFGDHGVYCPSCAQRIIIYLTRNEPVQWAPKRTNPRWREIHFIAGYGPSRPISLRHTWGAKVTGLSKDERIWRSGRTVWDAEPIEHNKPPKGRVHPLEGLGRFLNRMAEIDALAATSCCKAHLDPLYASTEHSNEPWEIPTVAEELAQNGVSSISLSSSWEGSEDDGTMDEVIATSDGAEYATMDLAALTRRIEWERQVKGSSLPRKAALAIDEKTGKISVTAKSHDLDNDTLLAMAKRLKTALAGRDAATLQNDRDRVEYYGKIGSCLYGVYSGSHEPEQTTDNLGAEDYEEDERNGGPQELGLHSLAHYTVSYEPRPDELWPMDVDATVLHTEAEKNAFWDEMDAMFSWAS